MFSNINEAWGHDPVKEITDKLSKDSFKTNTDHSEIFNFKNQNNYTNQQRVNNVTNKSKDSLSLSDINSLSLLSENTVASNNTDYGSFAPVNFGKYSKKKPPKINYHRFNDSDFSDSESSSDSIRDTKCDYSVKHLKKCDKCYNGLKKLINSKVNKKFDEMILENKMKQIQNATIPVPVTPQVPYVPNNSGSDSWKETLIIVIGAIIAMFIIFLIVKSLR